MRFSVFCVGGEVDILISGFISGGVILTVFLSPFSVLLIAGESLLSLNSVLLSEVVCCLYSVSIPSGMPQQLCRPAQFAYMRDRDFD